MYKDKIALQLYSVHDYAEKDLLGTIKKVAEMGYNGLEFAGFFDTPAKEVKSLTDSLGLKNMGSHTGLELLKNNIKEVIEYNKIIENNYIICPWAEFKSKDEIIELANFLNETGKVLNDNGLVLGYHNHAHEFVKFDGEYGLDILFKNTNPDLVKVEIDVFWVKRAALNPIEYLKNYKDRMPTIHLKEMSKLNPELSSEIGNGIIDFQGILNIIPNLGIDWLVIEQEKTSATSLNSAKISYDNLNKMVNF